MTLLSSPPVAGVWWAQYTWLSLWLSLLSTCSWCVVSAYTWLSLWLSLLSTCSWCVVSAYTWLALWLSLLYTCSWCGVRAYTWLTLWLSPPLHLYLVCGERIQLDCLYDSLSSPLVAGVWWEHTTWWLYDALSLSTCSWCVVSALVPLSCGSHRIIKVDAAHWWWLLRRDPRHMIVKCYWCTTIHNKALYKCIIHSKNNDKAFYLHPLWPKYLPKIYIYIYIYNILYFVTLKCFVFIIGN